MGWFSMHTGSGPKRSPCDARRSPSSSFFMPGPTVTCMLSGCCRWVRVRVLVIRMVTRDGEAARAS